MNKIASIHIVNYMIKRAGLLRGIAKAVGTASAKKPNIWGASKILGTEAAVAPRVGVLPRKFMEKLPPDLGAPAAMRVQNAETVGILQHLKSFQAGQKPMQAPMTRLDIVSAAKEQAAQRYAQGLGAYPFNRTAAPSFDPARIQALLRQWYDQAMRSSHL